jgi:hypothetical protein
VQAFEQHLRMTLQFVSQIVICTRTYAFSSSLKSTVCT